MNPRGHGRQTYRMSAKMMASWPQMLAQKREQSRLLAELAKKKREGKK